MVKMKMTAWTNTFMIYLVRTWLSKGRRISVVVDMTKFIFLLYSSPAIFPRHAQTAAKLSDLIESISPPKHTTSLTTPP